MTEELGRRGLDCFGLRVIGYLAWLFFPLWFVANAAIGREYLPFFARFILVPLWLMLGVVSAYYWVIALRMRPGRKALAPVLVFCGAPAALVWIYGTWDAGLTVALGLICLYGFILTWTISVVRLQPIRNLNSRLVLFAIAAAMPLSWLAFLLGGFLAIVTGLMPDSTVSGWAVAAATAGLLGLLLMLWIHRRAQGGARRILGDDLRQTHTG